MEETTGYGYTVEVPEGYDEAIIRTRLALRSESFSILTEAHVGGMLGPEAGSDRQYLFLAVWNAEIASQKIGEDMRMAVHLPCNVVIQEMAPLALVAAMDPADSVDPGAPESVLEDVRNALLRMLERVGSKQ